MPIRHYDDIGQRGPKDAKRHRDKQKKAIKDNLPEIIAEEDLITKRKGRKIKIPIRRLNIPVLRPGRRRRDDEGEDGGAVGIGQGPGKPGDVIGKKRGKGQQPGGAGEEPGEDYIETEIEVEELVDLMMEDLGLPNIKKKEIAELEVSLGFKISGLRKSGPKHLISRKHTIREGLKTFWSTLELLKTETELDEKICYWALKEADGMYEDALELLKKIDPTTTSKYVEDIAPFPIFNPQDMRFHSLQEKHEKESNAVVLVMLDVSGSMGYMKKYMARSMMFWLVEFLRKIYSNVVVRFIIYHSEARVVDEYTAFHTTESGGTKAVKAYELAHNLIETEYPTDKWNVYAFHFSDGDDFVPKESVGAARKLVENLGINMLGYVEMNTDNWGKGNLMPTFIEKMPLRTGDSKDLEIYVGDKNYPFVGAIVEDKEDIWPTIKELLRKDRWLT